MPTDSKDANRRPWLAPLIGLGQIMFQESAVTGAFFLVGIAVASPLMAFGAALATVVGTLTALLLRFDKSEIKAGLFGFNSALVGIACYFYLEPVPATHGFLIVGSIAASIVTYLMRRYLPFPSYTAPFIVVTWAVLAVAPLVGVHFLPHSGGPDRLDLWSAVSEGLSEVMFQANNWTGLLFLTGIALNSWKQAGWALLGSVVGLVIAVWVHDPDTKISAGLFGYNAALASMALALQRRLIIYPILAALVSVPITELFPYLPLQTLTAPFVLASWAVLAWDVLERRFQGRGF
jgi:urea transporter